MNDKGQIENHFVKIMIFVVVFAIIIFGVWAVATAGPLLVGSLQEIPILTKAAIPAQDQGTALGNATNVSMDTASNILGTVEFMVYMIFIALFIGYIVICYYVRTVKVLAIVWLFVIIIVLIASMIVSEQYQMAAADPTLSSFYETWGNSDFLMRNLPFIVGIVGVISGVLLFVIMQKDPDEEETVL